MQKSQIQKSHSKNDEAFWEKIAKTLSAERLNAYRQYSDSSNRDALCMKAWNKENFSLYSSKNPPSESDSTTVYRNT